MNSYSRWSYMYGFAEGVECVKVSAAVMTGLEDQARAHTVKIAARKTASLASVEQELRDAGDFSLTKLIADTLRLR